MSNDATALALAAGGVAGAYYLMRELIASEEKHARARAELELAGSSPLSPPRCPAYRPPRSAVTRRFDPMFAKHGRALPVAYLRALAKRESNMNPNETEDPAWGLLQVVEIVRHDYNKRHCTSVSRRELLDPATNITIASETIRRIVDNYQRFHPNVPNMREDWSNPRFVELVTFGWNAGYSERAGVGRVARWLEGTRDITDITILTIYMHAHLAGATKHLRNKRKLCWSKSVAQLYEHERARDAREAVS